MKPEATLLTSCQDTPFLFFLKYRRRFYVYQSR